ncbi:MAG: PAS domain S-box protein, partial [Acidobacteria bacterium]|nr:PAS domain S-box protein [Acidobacteriota bacterium]
HKISLAQFLAALEEGFEFETADCLEMGLARLAAGGIDLVLLDLNLAESQGLETFSQIHTRHQHVPIIVLTAEDDDKIAMQAVNAGAQDYLLKSETNGQILRRAMSQAIERQRAESALRESQRLIQEIADSTPEILSLFDLRSERIVYVNRQITTLLGYTSDDLDPSRLRDLIHPDDQGLLSDHLRHLLSTRRNDASEIIYRVKHADGEWRWLRSETLVFMRGEDGEPLQILSTTQDVTERKLAETERKQTEQRLREQAALLDCAQDAIIVRDLEGRILFWNRSAERIFGWKAEEVIGKNIRDHFMTKISAQIDEAGKKVLEAGEWADEMWQIRKDGCEIIVESRWTLVRDDYGKPKSILLINTDITEKKRFEAQFLRMQRLDSIGSLASGIAHDLNNSLAPVLMALHTLQQRFTDTNSQRWLTLIRKSTERSRDLIDKVLTFAKGTAGERLPLQPSQLINDVAKILNETLPKNVSLSVRLPGDLWNLIGDTTQIHQVLMNLCINARDAMPQGGTLILTAENITLAEKQVWMLNEVAPGRFVQITVSDTGIGMSPELIDRAFEPFFSTKSQGQGSGLGLSTAAGIVRSHGGFVSVTSIIGQGAQFKVYLPASDTLSDKQVETSETIVPAGSDELILVVEDEMELHEITRATLEAHGYRTLGASNGLDALALYLQYRDDIKLVLTDMSMPNLDGLSMSRALREINPKVKIIGTSGTRLTEKTEELSRAAIKTMLIKPFTAPQLLNALADAINEG